jgi:hypothetical protein
VEEEHRRALAVVDVGQPDPVSFPEMRREGITGKALEELVGCAHGVGHGRQSTLPKPMTHLSPPN